MGLGGSLYTTHARGTRMRWTLQTDILAFQHFDLHLSYEPISRTSLKAGDRSLSTFTERHVSINNRFAKGLSRLIEKYHYSVLCTAQLS